MKVTGTTMSMIRGDSESFIVSCVDADGMSVVFVDGDTIYFTVKKNANTEEKILQKVVTEFDEDGTALIDIDPEDTKNLSYTTYVYDIQLTDKNGTVTTIIPKSKFCICEEVTYE